MRHGHAGRSRCRSAPQLTGRVEFRKVSFGYQKDIDVVQDLSFVVKPENWLHSLASAEAGKSTLLSLLLRFYDPQQGQILIDGHDIRTFTLKSLRDQMTVVMQGQAVQPDGP